MAMNLIDRPFLEHDSATSHRAGSTAASVALHCTILLALIALARTAPDNAVSQSVAALVPDHITWIPDMNAGGGRFGGPDRAIAPPRRARVAGNQAASVPAPADLSNQITNNAPPEDIPSIPARAMGDSLTALPGAINGQSASDALGAGSPRGAGDTPGSGGVFGEGAARGAGVTAPTLLLQVKPRYTDDAMRMRIQGSVWVECVVMPDGTVGDARVMRSLDARFGLDEEAIAAAKQWRFRPGTLNGKPVPVVVSIELMFSLR
jgi:protein TonB